MGLIWACVNHMGMIWQLSLTVIELYGIDMGIVCQSYGNDMAVKRELFRNYMELV